MADPYIGEIRMFAGTFAPLSWSFCNGTLLPISEYSALFALIGTTYGGDGVTTFGLPDLRSRVPIHMSNNYVIGQNGGVEMVTVVSSQLNAHSHPFMASNNNASTANAQGNVLAQTPSYTPYISGFPANTATSNSSLSPDGGGGNQPHDNIQPYLAMNFIIALEGIFPPQS